MGKSIGKLKKTTLNHDRYGNLIEDEELLKKENIAN